ncbi:hypothetical protein HR11_01240 [Porphyromonas macacae]|uniref:hypothetical protein n=1 Tax=Porphyromonas macacae TaxID=28115 RepID=UPI00052BAB3D|nr:hypothetical protein [Porphyromonas macacae]KGO00523.1 hypothetical protein HR11_01240 [Porphyromonas macacae]
MMRKTILTFSLFFALFGFIVSANAQQKHDIVLKVQKGENFDMKSEIKMAMTIKIAGQAVYTEMNMNSKFNYKCQDRVNDTFDWIYNMSEVTTDVSTMGMKQRISSSDAPNAMNKPVIAMINKPVKYKTNKYNVLVGKIDAADMEKAINEVMPGQSKQLLKQIESTLTFGNLLPQKPIAQGEEFKISYRQELGMGGANQISGTGKLVKITDTDFVLEYKITNVAEIQGSTISGDGKMTVSVDRKSGMVKSQYLKMPLSGEMNVQGQQAEMNMELEQSTNIL